MDTTPLRSDAGRAAGSEERRSSADTRLRTGVTRVEGSGEGGLSGESATVEGVREEGEGGGGGDRPGLRRLGVPGTGELGVGVEPAAGVGAVTMTGVGKTPGGSGSDGASTITVVVVLVVAAGVVGTGVATRIGVAAGVVVGAELIVEAGVVVMVIVVHEASASVLAGVGKCMATELAEVGEGHPSS